MYTPDIERYTGSLKRALQDGWISSQGEYIEKAIAEARRVTGSPYVVLVNNGTSATHLLYKSLKYKYPNLSTIYVPNYVFVAVWNAGLYEYPASTFSVLEMDPATLNMRTDEEYILSLAANSAVVVVHNVGNVVNVPRLKRLRPDLVFVEDACESFLETYEGQITGTASLCCAISFFANKIVTTGEGGLYYTHDKDLYDFIYKSCHHGMTSERYVYDVLGYNYRMTNLQAALLYDQLTDIQSILATKRRVYERYVTLFGDRVATTGLWMMILRLTGVSSEHIARFVSSYGIDTRPMFYPIQRHSHLQDIRHVPQSIGHEELIMIPSSPTLSPYDQTYIWGGIEQYIRGISIGIERSSEERIRRFLANTLPPTFRYFNTRDPSVCASHELSIIALDGDTPIGYAHIDDRWVGICILPTHQSKGYGRFLLDFVVAYARVSNIGPLRLSVDIDNTRAFEMYVRRGFIPTRKTDSAYFMERPQ
jgi:perosamine synthetase